MSTKIYSVTYTSPHHVPSTTAYESATHTDREHAYLLPMPQQSHVEFVTELAEKLHGKGNVVSVKLMGIQP